MRRCRALPKSGAQDGPPVIPKTEILPCEGCLDGPGSQPAIAEGNTDAFAEESICAGGIPHQQNMRGRKGTFCLEPAQRMALQFIIIQAVAVAFELFCQCSRREISVLSRINIAVVDAAHPHRPAIFESREIPRVAQDPLRNVHKVEIGIRLDVEGCLRAWAR